MPNGDFEHLTEREMLIQIYERISVIPEHEDRISSLETAHTLQHGFVKGVTWIGGVLLTLLSALLGVHIARH